MTKINYSEKHIEAKLSAIGAKVVKASDMTSLANALLLDVQSEIANLYESLGDILDEHERVNKQKTSTVNSSCTAVKGRV